MITLRPYQIAALDAIKASHAAGVSRQLVVMATGTGKSVLFSNIQSHLGLTGQVWVLTARNELADQAAGHLRRNNPLAKIGIERAGSHAAIDCDFIVGSIQTIGTTGGGFTKRIQRFDPSQVAAVIVDEAHHSISGSYKNALRYFGVLKGDSREARSRLLVGVTATPTGRSDKAGLDAVFEKIVYAKDIREFIEDGWLAPIIANRVETEVVITGVRMARGDFAVGDLEKQVNTPERCDLIVQKYKELCDGKSAIAFTVNVNHSHQLAMAFRRAGVTALPFSGQTPDEERKRLFSAHESGEVKVLTSCSALGEGVDLPWAEVGLLCKPTASSLLYAQEIGRLLRPFPAPEAVAEGASRIKQAAHIIDFVDVSLRHRLITIPTLFGLGASLDLRGQSVTEALTEVEAAQEKFQQLRLDGFKTMAEMRSICAEIDLLKPPQVPEELRLLTDLCWISGPGGSYQIIGPMAHFSVRENQLGQFEIGRHEAGLRRHMMALPSLKDAIQRAESMIPEQDRRMLRSEAKWRMDAPSEKQIRLLAKLDREMFARFGRDMTRFSQFIISSYSKGDLSGMLSERMQAGGRR